MTYELEILAGRCEPPVYFKLYIIFIYPASGGFLSNFQRRENKKRKQEDISSNQKEQIKMVKCTRCCLYQSMKTVNLVVNLCGIGMIIYSLWLLKRWKQGFVDCDIVSSPLPRPLFIYTFLGVGIVVCLITLCSHMVFNFISPSTLSFYIAFVCFFLFLQGGFIIAIFFKIDWQAMISKWTDGQHEEFQNFLKIHLTVCRSIALTILFAQVNAVLLAVVLWAIGPESRNHCGDDSTSDSPELKQSFLVRSNESIIFNPNETGSSTINRRQIVV